MFVEDDTTLRNIYQIRLQAEGYTIIPAKDGEEALALVKAHKPDLIIADIMMPKVSGLDMLGILRKTEEFKDVKVIMLTALDQEGDERKAKELGADRYMVKTQVNLEDIIKTAQELLGEKPAEGSGGGKAPA